MSAATSAGTSAPARRACAQPLYNGAFWLVLGAFELFLFTLPLFPNGDGPVHLYLSSVFSKLATHRSPLYEHFYAIRHLVQPYSFHYYLLILLEHGMPADMAEKVFVGLIWATLAIGFRTLAQTLVRVQALTSLPGALNPGLSPVSLLVFPLLFSWPISAGFFNFSFGTGLLLFALAFYTRLGAPGPATPNLLAFLLTLVLLVLAHPIPLMVLICLVGLDLLLLLLSGWQRTRRFALPPWQAAALGLAAVAFVFPVLIADKAAVASSIHSLYPHLDLLLPMVLGYFVSCFHVANPLGWLYQALIVAMLPLSVLIFLSGGIRERLRRGTLGAADRLLLASLLFYGATFFFPDAMNGSAYFAVRMWYIVWLLAAVSLAPVVGDRRFGAAIAGFGAVLGLVSLFFGFLYIRPVARQQAELEQAPIPAHARGLFFQPLSGVSGVQTHTWWSLAFWDGVRAFVARDDVLVNTPWMQLTIVPVQENGRAGLLRDRTPNLYSESPSYLINDFHAHPEQKGPALALADFLLLADPNGTPPDPLALARTFLGPLAPGWRCTAHDFYAVCTRN